MERIDIQWLILLFPLDPISPADIGTIRETARSCRKFIEHRGYEEDYELSPSPENDTFDFTISITEACHLVFGILSKCHIQLAFGNKY